MRSTEEKLREHIKSLEPSSAEMRENFLKRTVLSLSGLRFICGTDENDLSHSAPQEAMEFVLATIYVHGKLLQSYTEKPVVWLGMDSRPTGRLFFYLAARLFAAMGIEVKATGFAPIPEIMAATHQSGGDGFCYFTASHNPAGHNGLKLGLGDGAVLKKELALPLIQNAKDTYTDTDKLRFIRELVAQSPLDAEGLEENVAKHKAVSLEYYEKFSLKTLAPTEPESFLPGLEQKIKPLNASVLFDMNGSSRLSSVDQEMVKKAGLGIKVIGDTMGAFSHAIVPEGASLDEARALMQTELDEGNRILAAMVPDCDGDRGNLILPLKGKATALKAQETFALCVLAEVCAHRARGETAPLAVAVNGPTSMRLDTLLKPFDVKVARAEVGEANVLAMAAQLRGEGYIVPISGEGSNGGNIMTPGTVRDPLMTLFALLRFLYLEIPGQGMSGAEYFLKSVGKEERAAQSTILERVIDAFPTWQSTDAFDDDALMPVPAIEHEVLKTNYETAFVNHWNQNSELWHSWGVSRYEFMSYEGVQNIPGPGGRPAPGKGGLAVLLYNQNDEGLGYVWMRGSGTEPVFRVLVDWCGAQEAYPQLLQFHRTLIAECAQ
ncbi:MAG: hypothetical protein HQL32_06890 [Planctomycetes bacterium]|nr:hypothetical protein [Planctomycetota bacterium]